MPALETEGELQALLVDLHDHPLVTGVRLEPVSPTGFAADPELIGGLVLLFTFRHLGEALVGKSADALWTLLRRAITKLRTHLRNRPAKTSGPRLSVKYVGHNGPSTVEIRIGYDDLQTLRADLRNHRQYAALALGFAARSDDEVEHDLRGLLPSTPNAKPAAFTVRKQPRAE